MNKYLTLFLAMSLSIFSNAQNTPQDSIAFHQSFITEGAKLNNMPTARATVSSPNGQFTVGGDASTYYPVVFQDASWLNNETTVLNIGRSNVHENGEWKGSLIASFKFHGTRRGHGSSFVDADIKQRKGYLDNEKSFIGGWLDTSGDTDVNGLIIWLKGASTYYYHANCAQLPVVGSSNLVIGKNTYNVKTLIDDYVNEQGSTLNKNIWVLGNHINYFKERVGIGTTIPKYKLDVNGKIGATDLDVLQDINAGKNILLSNGELTYIYNDNFEYDNKKMGHYALKWVFDSWNSGAPSLWLSGLGGFRLFVGGGPSFVINQLGNVGIGIPNPKNKLDVKGTIRATEVKVEALPWADFVFDKDYKLPILSEVESHIEEYKHLPGIPSESEVKENGGVGLGEMQVKLLQKIEELTLYVIGQEKRIQELETELKKNKK